MTEELIQSIVYGIPNFAGFSIGIFALLLVIKQKNDLIKLLIDKWAECEDDSEKSRLMNKGE